MKVEERKRTFITLTKEEKEMLHKVSTLIENIYDNMNIEDEFALIEDDAIIESYVKKELREVAELLFDMREYTLEII